MERNRQKPTPHINNLFENMQAIPLHAKITTLLTGKPSPCLPQCWPAHRAQAVSKLRLPGACGVSATGFQHCQTLGLCPEEVSLTSARSVFPLPSLSGYWEAPCPSPSGNCFLPACPLAVASAGSTDPVTMRFQRGLKFKLTQFIPR